MNVNEFGRARIVTILTAGLGALMALGAGAVAPPATARTVDPPREPTIEQRVEAVRQRHLRESESGDTLDAPKPRSVGALTQWYNWPNWSNGWGNWSNWRNW